jgi:SAM-dependent methyltransferase
LNIFDIQTDFITRDPRTADATARAFTADGQLARFEAWIQPDYLKDKSVLDLGCCLAAFGGYALSNGASRYVGVEISESLATMAKENLTKYYINGNWDIVVDSCEHFLDVNIEDFDIVIAGGVLHGITNFLPVLTAMTECAKVIVIESVHPPMPFVTQLVEEIAQLQGEESYERLQKIMLGIEYTYPMVGYSNTGKMMHHDNKEAVTNIIRPLPSIAALITIMGRLGYKDDIRGYVSLKKTYPDHYGWMKRFVINFFKIEDAKPMSYSELLNSDHKELMEWKEDNAKGTI